VSDAARSSLVTRIGCMVASRECFALIAPRAGLNNEAAQRRGRLFTGL